jgi:hypothetical protein
VWLARMIPACIIRLVVSCSEGFWRLASEQDGIVGMHTLGQRANQESDGVIVLVNRSSWMYLNGIAALEIRFLRRPPVSIEVSFPGQCQSQSEALSLLIASRNHTPRLYIINHALPTRPRYTSQCTARSRSLLRPIRICVQSPVQIKHSIFRSSRRYTLINEAIVRPDPLLRSFPNLPVSSYFDKQCQRCDEQNDERCQGWNLEYTIISFQFHLNFISTEEEWERKLTNTVFLFKSSAWLVASLYGHVAFGPPLTQQPGTPGVSNILIKVVLRAHRAKIEVYGNSGVNE